MANFGKIAIIILVLSSILHAQLPAAVWTGETDTDWYNEEDTEFIITTAEQLAGLAELVNNGNDFSGKTIKLGNDIVLNDTTGWQEWETNPPDNEWGSIGVGSIGVYTSRPFSGILDGFPSSGHSDT